MDVGEEPQPLFYATQKNIFEMGNRPKDKSQHYKTWKTQGKGKVSQDIKSTKYRKNYKLDFISTKDSCPSKDTINKMKCELQTQKICAKIPDEDLVLKIKKSCNLVISQQPIFFFKTGTRLEQTLRKR